MQQLNPREQAVLKKISGDKDLANYFFARVSDAKWFYPLKDKCFFESKKNPQRVETKDKGFFTIPRWNVLDYLEKISKECREPQNKEYAKELIQIIRDVTNYRDESGQKVDNYRTWWAFTKILINLPSAVITLEDTDLIAVWMDSKFNKPFVADIGQRLLPKFLESDNQEDHQKALKIIEIINSKKSAIRTDMDSYYLEKIYSNENCRLLGERCGYAPIETLVKKLTEIIEYNYSYIWRPAIENHKQNIHNDKPKDIYLSALRDVLIYYLSSESDVSGKENNLKKLLANDLSIIKRAAIFAINKNWDQYKNLFWGFIQKEHFRESNFRHEIYMLLQENFKLFEEKEKQRIISFIEDCAKIILQEKTEKTDHEKQRYAAHWKQSWLSAMVSQGNQKIDNLYNECKKVTKKDPKYPEFASYTYSRTGSKSPLTIEKLLSKNVPEIVRYLNQFTSEEGWDNPTEDGLAWVLRQAVKEDSAKFEAELNEFSGVKLLYIAHMLSAFEELWRNKKIIKWRKVLEFCQEIVNKEGFWRDESSNENTDLRYRNWVVSAIAGLIEEGTRSDEWAFDPDHLSLAEQILLKLNENQASQMNEKEIKDAVNTALNTAKGHIVRALVNYALRVARIEKESGKDKEAKWSDSVKNEFDKELEKSSEERNLEFSTFIGEYLPQLDFLDKSWVIENINKIFPKEHPSHWDVTMQGYLWAPKAYPHLYTLLREKSHYKKAMADFEDWEIREKLVQHICLGYLWGIEALEGGESLFYRLLTEWASSEIQEIIHFFWMQRDAAVIEKEIFNHVLDFWRYCYEKLNGLKGQGELTSENKRIASNLSLLTAFLRDISDENRKWLLLIAPYAGENHQTTSLIKYLNKLADEKPGAVGEIFLKMIEKIEYPELLPSYKEDNIVAIVEKLYKAKENESANKICEKYAIRYAGHDNFLLPACSKNNL